MILVTGATGTIGRTLIDLLRRDGAAVRAVTRDASAADLPAGVDVFEGDPAGDAALAGVTALFLHPRAVGDAAYELVARAREHGARRVVALSALNVDDDPADQPSRYRGDRNREAERAAVDSGLEWTSLRASSFDSNAVPAWAGQIRAGDVVRYVHAGFEESPVDERDLAAVAASALLTDVAVGRRLELTGPESLSHERMVAILGAAIGRPLRFEQVPPEIATRGMLAGGLPEPFVTALMARYAKHLDKPQHLPTDDIERVLGRPARTFREWAANHAALFRG